MLTTWFAVAGSIALALLLAAGLLHLLSALGLKSLVQWFAHAPGLDLWILYFTILPLIAGPIALARLDDDPLRPMWSNIALGLLAGVVAQIVAVLIWCRLHELAHREAARGPRIVSQLNRTVGPVRNNLAVWWTTWAVPLFALIRVAEILVYPPLTWLIKLPKYKTRDWVNVSRHKFDGLVGYDLIWCLYCDWMTGLWSLGSEMLRNIESFWCPIRFDSAKKCANCSIDFPDIRGGWAPADGNMGDAVAALARHYPGPNGENAWFGHPVRLTREGETLETDNGSR